MSHLKLEDKFSPTRGELMGTLTVYRAIGRPSCAGDRKAELNLIRSRSSFLLRVGVVILLVFLY